jgi:N-methylhydantoinase B
VFGGKAGHGGRMQVHNIAKPEEARAEYAKFSGMRAEAGDVVTYFSPVGGGYGDPLERDPQAVLRDVLERWVSAKAAHDVYGVVLAEEGPHPGLTVDPQGTRERRETLSRERDARRDAADRASR